MKICEHTWIQENPFFRMCLDCGKSECSCGDNNWEKCTEGVELKEFNDDVNEFFYDDFL